MDVPAGIDGQPSLPSLLTQLGQSTWAYAALGALVETGLLERLTEPKSAGQLAEETGLAEALVRTSLDVAVALEIVSAADDRYTAAEGVIDLYMSPQGQSMRLFIRSDFLQTSDLLQRAHAKTLRPGWFYTDPDILNAQGIGSGRVMESLCRDVIPKLDGLEDRLAGPDAAFLDVGAGVGGICMTLARLWPGLRIVGLEPAEAPLAEARRNIAATDYGDRIELRKITLEDLTDVDQFDVGWLPQVFLALDVLQRSIGPFYRSIKPGGWAILFALSGGGTGLGPAIARFRNVVWGGEPHAPEDVAKIMTDAGFEGVHTSPAAGIGGATLVIGRKPSAA